MQTVPHLGLWRSLGIYTLAYLPLGHLGHAPPPSGENYLLLTRKILKSWAMPPPPRRSCPPLSDFLDTPLRIPIGGGGGGPLARPVGSKQKRQGVWAPQKPTVFRWSEMHSEHFRVPKFRGYPGSAKSFVIIFAKLKKYSPN